jgi:hypothetical protein
MRIFEERESTVRLCGEDGLLKKARREKIPKEAKVVKVTRNTRVITVT